MGETVLLDGKAIAAQIKSEVSDRTRQLSNRGIRPGLAAVLVGENPASRVYVGSKVKTCHELGLYSEKVELPAATDTAELLSVVDRLNRDDAIDGILVQLPLPAQIDTRRILEAVDPTKDVDGFHPVNVGKLCGGQETLCPCTPLGIIEILKRSGIEILGKRAVVLGRSDIVGKPIAFLLLHRHATVTLCHSRTRDLPAVTREADILIAAIGKPAFVTEEFVRPGAVVIDVGINTVKDRASAVAYWGEASPRLLEFDRKGSALVGDVHPLSVTGIAGHLTPVPGGVGPLTIAMLMSNTVKAALLRRGMA
jgi:methylenetetrahydrofolate dehydrogenase (NADP+) / methenyltetrahydrofolate cyclohydrolase